MKNENIGAVRLTRLLLDQIRLYHIEDVMAKFFKLFKVRKFTILYLISSGMLSILHTAMICEKKVCIYIYYFGFYITDFAYNRYNRYCLYICIRRANSEHFTIFKMKSLGYGS